MKVADRSSLDWDTLIPAVMSPVEVDCVIAGQSITAEARRPGCDFS